MSRHPATSSSNAKDEVANLGNILKQLASESGCKQVVQPIFQKESLFTGHPVVRVEVLLLSDDPNPAQLDRFTNWTGQNDLHLKAGEPEEIHYQSHHFLFNSFQYQQRPVRRVADEKPTIKVLAYTPDFAEREFFEVILKGLTAETPCCFLVCLADEDPALNLHRLKLYSNCQHVEAFAGRDLTEKGLLDLVVGKDFEERLKTIRLYHQINDYAIAGTLIQQNLQLQQQQVGNNRLLNEREKIKYRHRENEVSTKDINGLRSDLSKSFKNIGRIIDDQAAQLDLESEGSYLTKVKTEIDHSDKFYEEDGVKSILFKVPDGVIENMRTNIFEQLKNDFDRAVKAIKDQLSRIENEVRNSFRDLGVPSPVLVSKPLSPHLSEEVLNQNLRFHRSYEKQITKKGISHLMMEIRTPLFMIMPLMMFAGIFASFFQSDDRGQLLPANDYNGKRAVIITDLPDYYKKRNMSFRKFAEKVIYQSSLLQYNNKMRVNQFLMDSQENPMLKFEIKSVEKWEGTGANRRLKREISYKPDYDFLPNGKGLILYCEGNVAEVKEILMDCSKGILCRQERGGTFSIYKIGSLFAQLGAYRYLVIFVLFGLIAWFVSYKKKEFAEEKLEIRDREKKNLKQALKQDVEKMVRTSVTRWRSKLQDYIREQEGNLQFAVDNSLNKVIDLNKQKVQEQMGIIERRAKNFQEEKSRIGSLQKDLDMHLKKLMSLKMKFQAKMNQGG